MMTFEKRTKAILLLDVDDQTKNVVIVREIGAHWEIACEIEVYLVKDLV